MFTSRAEYRLALRADNADLRLTPKGMALGCVSDSRIRAFEAKMAEIDKARDLIESHSLSPSEAQSHGLPVGQDGQRRTAAQLLAFPTITFDDLAEIFPDLAEIPPGIAAQVAADCLYAHYVERQKNEVAALMRDEGHEIPRDLDFEGIAGLSSEVRAKLTAVRPETLGQAGRIEGMTPAALTILLAAIRMHERRKAG